MMYVDKNFGTNTSIFSSRTRGLEAEAFEAPTGSVAGDSPAVDVGTDSRNSAKLSSALWSLQSGSEGAALDETPRKPPEEEFGELADMSFGDRLMQQYLGEHGLTKEDLASMPAEEREKIVEEVRHQVLEASKQQQNLTSQAEGKGSGVSALGALEGLGQADLNNGDNNKRGGS